MSESGRRKKDDARRRAERSSIVMPDNGFSLRELEAKFMRYETRVETYKRHVDGALVGHQHTDACWVEVTGPRVYHVRVSTLVEAQGVQFLCPLCFAANGGPVGTHSVLCWSRSRGTPDDAHPLPGRWKLDGTGIDDLTLNADPPSSARSVKLEHGCQWHGFVTNGRAK